LEGWEETLANENGFPKLGRPRAISAVELKSVDSQIEAKTASFNAVSSEELNQMLKSAAKRTAAQQEVSVPTRILSHSSLIRYRKSLDVKKRKVPRKPKARAEAELDVRNAVSIGVLLEVVLNTWEACPRTLDFQHGHHLHPDQRWKGYRSVSSRGCSVRRDPIPPAKMGKALLPFQGKIIVVESAAGWATFVVVFVIKALKR